MKHTELVEKLAEMTDLPVKKSKEYMNAFVQVLTEGLSEDDKIVVQGLGIFETGVRAASTMKSLQDPTKIIEIPEKKTVKLKFSKTIKDALNK